MAVRFSEKVGDALQLCLGKGLPAEPDGGHAFFCPNVPTTVLAHNGPRDIGPLIAAKVKAATGQDLVRSVRTPAGLVVVLPSPAKPFRLFGSPFSKPMKDKAEVRQCINCFGFHNTAKCYGVKRYVTCGSNKAAYTYDVLQCLGCLGPHGPTFSKYLARPVVNNGKVTWPSKE